MFVDISYLLTRGRSEIKKQQNKCAVFSNRNSNCNCKKNKLKGRSGSDCKQFLD